MTKPRLLDLFCGAGGAAMGYHRAGFTVIGVDINPQPNYPFEFHQGDALDLGRTLLASGEFEAVHASPPCQRWSTLGKRNGNADQWPALIEPARQMFKESGLPYVIENVPGAPLHEPSMLCGTMFEETRVLRHRLFETSFTVEPPEHKPHPLVFTHDKRKAHYGKLDQDTSYVQVTGGGNCTADNKRDAMRMYWATGRECNEAIPPAYTEHIGKQLMAKMMMVKDRSP